MSNWSKRVEAVEGKKSSCSDEGRRNDMRSTDGEKGGTPREEGRRAIKRAAAGIQQSLAEQPEEVDCTNVRASGLNHQM